MQHEVKSNPLHKDPKDAALLSAEWAAKYPFPAESKEFKKYMEKIPRGTSGIKIKYSESKKRSPLWDNRQERPFPYVGVRRKNQPSVVV